MRFFRFLNRPVIKSGSGDEYTFGRIAAHSTYEIADFRFTDLIAVITLSLDVNFFQTKLVFVDDSINSAITRFRSLYEVSITHFL